VSSRTRSTPLRADSARDPGTFSTQGISASHMATQNRLVFLLAIAFSFSIPWILTQPRDAYCESAPSKGGSQQVTVVGCSQKGISWFLSSADSKEYKLTGNIFKLDEGPTGYVQVSGTLIPSEDKVFPDGAIEVASVKELPGPSAKLSPAIAKSADWRKYTDKVHGIAYSIPVAFPPWDSQNEQDFETGFVDKGNVTTLARFEIPRDAWGSSNFVGGELAVYANFKITNVSGCYPLQESEVDDERSADELIRGVRFVHDQESSVPPEEFDFYHVFQNGRCYEIVFDFSFDRIGANDLGCMVPIMDPESLIKPVLSGISFFEPEQSKPAVRKSSRH
jgi:hypothetical protein